MPPSYLVITPVRNEARFIAQTIRSMIAQSLPPTKWVIVDDGSTDETPAIIADFLEDAPFLNLVVKPESSESASSQTTSTTRTACGGPPKAFNFGLKGIDLIDFDFVVKLDGDLAFDRQYFERLLNEFQKDPRLGIAGGHCYQLHNHRLKIEKVPSAHVRGATKIYRRQCFLEIGGVAEVFGWDTIDELKAQMKGWTTRSFAKPPLTHLKPTGSAHSILGSRYSNGWQYYWLGYHPLFMGVRAIRRLGDKPYVLGGLAMWAGYFSAWMRRSERYKEVAVRTYLRNQQMQRLMWWRHG